LATKYDDIDYNVDYQALIDDAVAKGDYATAAKNEQLRNQKIEYLNANGTNKWGATTTNLYTQYLPIGDDGSGGGNTLQDENIVTPSVTPDMTYPTIDIEEILGMVEIPTENSYSQLMDEALNAVLNRDPFSYDPNSDPLWQQYMSTYTREGNRAMRDTLAGAASGAGGMNSYALAAAQQANNYYMAQMGDKLPELYKLAYDMYMDEGDTLMSNFEMVKGLYDTDYNHQMDALANQWEKAGLLLDYWGTSLDEFWKDKEFDTNELWKQKQWEQGQREWEYGVQEDQKAEQDDEYNRILELIAAGAVIDEETLKSVGLTTDIMNDIRETLGLAPVSGTTVTPTGNGNVGSYGGYDYSNGGGNYDNAGLDRKTVEQIQTLYGAGVDGLWGEETTKKVGMTAAEWVAKYGTGVPDGDDETIDLGADDSYYGKGELTEAQIKEMQAYYGTPVDGKWGPNSVKAAGGLDVMAAWDNYQEEKKLDNSIIGLNIGPVSPDLVRTIMEFGGIKEVNGKLVWTNGWSAGNWEKKLAAANRTGSLGLFKGTLSY